MDVVIQLYEVYKMKLYKYFYFSLDKLNTGHFNSNYKKLLFNKKLLKYRFNNTKIKLIKNSFLLKYIVYDNITPTI